MDASWQRRRHVKRSPDREKNSRQSLASRDFRIPGRKLRPKRSCGVRNFVEKKAPCILQWEWQTCGKLWGRIADVWLYWKYSSTSFWWNVRWELNSVFLTAPAITSAEKLLSLDESLMLRREPRENLKIRRSLFFTKAHGLENPSILWFWWEHQNRYVFENLL